MMMEDFHEKEVEDMKPIDPGKLQDWRDYGDDVKPSINEVANVEEVRMSQTPFHLGRNAVELLTCNQFA